MAMDTRIVIGGRRIPVVAFFGTKGGVGKTTISRRFAELVTLAPGAPNVLLVDGDVYHRGMTVEMTKSAPISCKTIHDYIASRNTSDVEAMDLTAMVQGRRPDSGRLFFVPASLPEAKQVFDEGARTAPEAMLKVLHEVVSSAATQYRCACVVIDCGPIIDRYTAGSSMLADRAFIIGINEPISFSSLKTYPNQIRDHFPEFTTAKMRVIINRVNVWEMLEERKLTEDIVAAIPDFKAVVEKSEGLSDPDVMQMMLFEDHITQVIEKAFQGDHPELIPERRSAMPPKWDNLLEQSSELHKTPKLRRLGTLQLLLPVGLLVLAVGVLLFVGGSSDRHRAERARQAASLVSTLESTVTAAEASNSQAAAAARNALAKARAVDPGNEESWNLAVEASRVAGVTEIPPLVRGDTGRETMGLGIAAGGLLLAGIGFSCWRSRRTYLGAIRGIRKGGAKWMMSEMTSKRSARKTFDDLLKAVS